MSESKLVFLLVAMITFVIGVMVGERSKGTFFRPWGEDGRLYIGDQVRFREHSKYAELYNSCKSMILLGLQAANGNVAWILAEDCSAFPNEPHIFTDVVAQDCLEKQTK